MIPLDLKVVILGASCSGKTSLVEKYIYDRFDSAMSYQNTIGAAFGTKQLEIDGGSITMGIWDTAGGERYETMNRLYYRGAKAAIICYDPTERASFERGQFWINELKKHEENCRVYICQTKKDITDCNNLLRQIDLVTALKFAAEMNSILFETSSKTGQNINELFYAVALDYVSSNPKTTYCDSDCVKLTESKNRRTCCSNTAK